MQPPLHEVTVIVLVVRLVRVTLPLVFVTGQVVTVVYVVYSAVDGWTRDVGVHPPLQDVTVTVLVVQVVSVTLPLVLVSGQTVVDVYVVRVSVDAGQAGGLEFGHEPVE